jgi:hypothetical protein
MKTFYFSFLLFITFRVLVYCQCSATGAVSGASSADNPGAELVGAIDCWMFFEIYE